VERNQDAISKSESSTTCCSQACYTSKEDFLKNVLVKQQNNFEASFSGINEES
jgi:hypothetical protein